MKIILTLTLAVLLSPVLTRYGAQVAMGQTSQKSGVIKTATLYECPMHPEVTKSKRGRCPKCGMALRLKKREIQKNATPAAGAAAALKQDDAAVSVRQIPDVPVADQNGKQLNFYKDLVAGKVVAINFIFTTCTAICPSLSATFRRVQQELGELVGRDVWLISVSVDPTTDTPERLKEFAAKFKAGPGWTFVTGERANIDLLLRALGVGISDKNDHTPMVLIGNEASGSWTRAYGLSPPAALAKLITDATK